MLGLAAATARVQWNSSRWQWRAAFSTMPYNVIHKPVLLEQVLEQLAPKAGGTYCDLTFGDGGYTKAILDRYDCKVVAVDQDPIAYEKALQMASMETYRGRLFPWLGRFGQIHSLVKKHKPDWSVPCFDGIVMDIGVSSGQLETASRGFSYKLDGPLDMRMFSRGRDAGPNPEHQTAEAELLERSISAYEVVNYFSRDQIADIIYQYGGDRVSRKIASAIVDARQHAPINSTAELAAIVNKACPQPRWQRGDDDMVRNSAARTFQAIRIFVNDELGELRSALRATEYLLKPQGRLAVVTFHSLEDKIVKTFMQHGAGRRSVQDAAVNQFHIKRAVHRQQLKSGRRRGQVDEMLHQQQQPVIGEPSFTLCTKHVIQPSLEEREENSRSRSAKLRAVERTAAPPLEPFGALSTDKIEPRRAF
ncbi:MraW methylase family-domain-containing protein [Dichotomocladium elegans]|nr:MraW methylase family-domain-containing protein [Dichotomocladium elegans]